MALEGWYQDWYASGYFPAVWFAPGDESSANPDDLRKYTAEVELGVYRKKSYIKRGKRFLIFDTPEDADAYLEAEKAANEAIEKAQKTSRRARKRVREKVYRAAPQPEVIDTSALLLLVQRFELSFDLAPLIAEQNIEELARIALILQEMQDDEEVEMLLLA